MTSKTRSSNKLDQSSQQNRYSNTTGKKGTDTLPFSAEHGLSLEPPTVERDHDKPSLKMKRGEPPSYRTPQPESQIQQHVTGSRVSASERSNRVQSWVDEIPKTVTVEEWKTQIQDAMMKEFNSNINPEKIKDVWYVMGNAMYATICRVQDFQSLEVYQEAANQIVAELADLHEIDHSWLATSGPTKHVAVRARQLQYSSRR